MNEILLLIEIVGTFSIIVLANKLFGKAGLFAWMGIASILANIQVCKSVDLFGISGTLGNVMFASTFLATDILSECYGKKDAKKGVYIGLFAIGVYLACTQLSLVYRPNTLDTVQTSMLGLFKLAPRVCLSSVTMFFLANILDVHLYNKLKDKFKGNKMWLRNNISTVICNCLENFGFVLLAFGGIFPFKEVIAIAISTSLIEMLVALCDTPFLYLAKGRFRCTKS